MGLAFAQAYPEAAEILSWSSDLLGENLHRLLGRGGSWLNNTALVQPVMVTVGLIASRVLQSHGISPTLCAGHSVGELAAWRACLQRHDFAITKVAGAGHITHGRLQLLHPRP